MIKVIHWSIADKSVFMSVRDPINRSRPLNYQNQWKECKIDARNNDIKIYGDNKPA